MSARRSVRALCCATLVSAALLHIQPSMARAAGDWCDIFRVALSYGPPEFAKPFFDRMVAATVESVDADAEFQFFEDYRAIDEVLRDLHTGQRSMAIFSASQLSSHFDGFAALQYPGLLDSASDVARMYEGGNFLSLVEEDLGKLDLSILGFIRVPYALYSREDIKTYGDMSGQEVWAMPGVYSEVVSAWGGMPIQSPDFSSKSVWEQGRVSNAIQPIWTTGDSSTQLYYSGVKTAIVSEQFAGAIVIVGSDSFLSKARADKVSVFRQVSRAVSQEYSQELLNNVERWETKLRDRGVNIIDNIGGDFSSYGLIESHNVWDSMSEKGWWNQEEAIAAVTALAEDLDYELW